MPTLEHRHTYTVIRIISFSFCSLLSSSHSKTSSSRLALFPESACSTSQAKCELALKVMMRSLIYRLCTWFLSVFTTSLLQNTPLKWHPSIWSFNVIKYINLLLSMTTSQQGSLFHAKRTLAHVSTKAASCISFHHHLVRILYIGGWCVWSMWRGGGGTTGIPQGPCRNIRIEACLCRV